MKSYSSLIEVITVFTYVISEGTDINLYFIGGSEYRRLMDDIVVDSGQNFADFSFETIQNFSKILKT